MVFFSFSKKFLNLDLLSNIDATIIIVISSIFDDIKGIGPKRKKELLLHFGTIQKIKSASLDELKQVKTIPSNKLEELYEFFNG